MFFIPLSHYISEAMTVFSTPWEVSVIQEPIGIRVAIRSSLSFDALDFICHVIHSITAGKNMKRNFTFPSCSRLNRLLGIFSTSWEVPNIHKQVEIHVATHSSLTSNSLDFTCCLHIQTRVGKRK